MKIYGKLLCHDGINTIHNLGNINPYEIVIYVKNNIFFYRFEDLEGKPFETEHFVQFQFDSNFHKILK